MFDLFHNSDFRNWANLPKAINATVMNINNDTLHTYPTLDTYVCFTILVLINNIFAINPFVTVNLPVFYH